MKNCKANVSKRELRSYNRGYDLYTSKVVKVDRIAEVNYALRSYKDFGCQYESKRDNVVCTCKKNYHRSVRRFKTRLVHNEQDRYPGWKSYTDIGVGSIKTLPKRRTRRIYLPETDDRGVGNSDYSSLFEQTKRPVTSYYEQKRTSSKCVGPVAETGNAVLINEKLSPIFQTRSCATSPIDLTVPMKDFVRNIDTYKISKNIVAHIECTSKRNIKTGQTVVLEKESPQISLNTKEEAVQKTGLKSVQTCTDNIEKDFSSDSLVQHVHNLENPSFDKQIRSSIDPMENKLEREYRKMFTTKKHSSIAKSSVDKPISELKSASMLRRRFEALRKGKAKKEDMKKDSIEIKDSSQTSFHSRKDVSIASDPPSLEPKSYSNTKIYSPYTSFTRTYVNSPSKDKYSRKRNELISSNWSTENIDSDIIDSQGVKGMFKLWGKKFNFEEDNYKKSSPKSTISTAKRTVIVEPEKVMEEKKNGKRFFFFKKRSKDKTKQVFKTKKGVTAGRCEVEDGLTIKIGTKERPKNLQEHYVDKEIEDFDSILRKSWLQTYLTSKVESNRSVKIRWNNNMYTTSSSTVFELLDCVYKNTGLAMRSRSDVTTGDSSNYYTSDIRAVNFIQKNIQAWMIPKTIYPHYQILDLIKKRGNDRNRNIAVTYSGRKWYIDQSTCGNKIELVLQSKNFIKTGKSNSSDYVLIDIPKGYFTDSATLNNDQSSDEEVYKITDYESNSYSFKRNEIKIFDTGDHLPDKISFTKPTYEKVKLSTSKTIDTINDKALSHKDVPAQGSKNGVPNHCDVISVGIITHRDIRDIKKPIIKIQDEVTDSESIPNMLPPKKCEFAERYLQDYYRHYGPLGIDLFSSCLSDSNVRCSSENNSETTLNNQGGDGSKSCPNMFEDYQTANIISSCNTSSCSHCYAFDDLKKQDKTKKDKPSILGKILKKNCGFMPESRRVSPKDSLEVFRKRKLYACGNKSNWNACQEPCSTPSSDEAHAQKECYKYPIKPKKTCKKHVSIPDCEVMECKKLSCVKTITSGCDTCDQSSSCQLAKPRPPPKKPSPCPSVLQPPPSDPPPRIHLSQKSIPCTSPPCLHSAMKSRHKSSITEVPPCISSSCKQCHPEPCVRTAHKPSPCKPLTSNTTTCMSPKPSCRSPPPIPPSESSDQNNCRLNLVSQATSPSNTPKCVSPSASPPQTPPKEESMESLQSLNKQQVLPRTCSPCTKCSPPSPPRTPCKCCSEGSACCSQNSLQKTGLKLQMTQKKVTKDKECSPNCANRKKLNQIISAKIPTDSFPESAANKLMSKKRPCPKSCLSNAANETLSTIRLNSKENITINLKKSTPSTEEIRDCLNIKVQDEDGRTLYERIDYRKCSEQKSERGTGPDSSFIPNMYRDSHIHRVSTTTCLNEVEKENSGNLRSCSSLSNLIEINFTVKLKNLDKITDININNCGDNHVKENATDVFVVQDERKNSAERITNDKNDVNISICIKNFKETDGKKTKKTQVPTTRVTEEFSKKISQKFQTIATGYSEFHMNNHTTAFSLRATAVDICSSVAKTKSMTKLSGQEINEGLLKTDHSLTLSDACPSSTEQILTDYTTSSIKNDIDYEIKTDISEKCSKEDSVKDNIESHTDKSETGVYFTDDEKTIEVDVRDVTKLKNSRDKKEMLKKLLEKAASVKNKNKEAVRTMRDMLQCILTSDSSCQEDTDTGNEFIKELTYESLKPNYFRDSDSMSNYYNLDSTISEEKYSPEQTEETLLPTKENSSQSNKVAEKKGTPGTCMCSAMAARLNMKTQGSCCCRAREKKDEEIICDLSDKISQNSVGIQISSKKSFKQTLVATHVSTIVKITPEKSRNDLQDNRVSKLGPRSIQTCVVQEMSKKMLVRLPDYEKFVVKKQATAAKDVRRLEQFSLADALQSNETKKAVLEIYAEKISTGEGRHTVAKLPKYVISRESKVLEFIEVTQNGKDIRP